LVQKTCGGKGKKAAPKGDVESGFQPPSGRFQKKKDGSEGDFGRGEKPRALRKGRDESKNLRSAEDMA
jgi:hypothetical protein